MNTNRRTFLAAGAFVAAASPAAGFAPYTSEPKAPAFRFCLNTSTIREQKVGLEKEVEIAAAAGFDGIEPWIPTMREFVEKGGSLTDLGKKISDLGLTVDSAIGFAQWIVDDEAKRTAALEEAKRDMDMLKAIGGTRIAAPPVGAHGGDSPTIDLRAAGERFRALQDIGDQIGVVPQLEVWGFSKNLSRVSEVLFVVAEAGHPRTQVLLDVYHLFKGGSDFSSLNLFADDVLQVFHINDYPATPPRAEMNDSHRVYPGDGIAPLKQILSSLGGNGRSITLSLELFNRDYWKQDPLEVAKTGLGKMKSSVE